MPSSFRLPQCRNLWRLAGVSLACLSAVGCARQPVAFSENAVYAEVLEAEQGVALDEARGDVAAVLTELFGTPSKPRWPDETAGRPSGEGKTVPDALVSLERLERAAGRVYSDEQDVHFGLYREHCNSCHGVSGDGRGPASLLQRPYPRDFRAGVFKYKSTAGRAKPTRGDLTRTLRRGLPGVPMPSFQLLPGEDVEALVDYLIYLSVRGELERRLLRVAALDLDYGSESGERWLRPDQREDQPKLAAEQQQWIAEELAVVLRQWREAESRQTEVPSVPADLDAPQRVARGREWFHGKIANCAACHGEGGAGDPQLPDDYDDWTKEWTTGLGINPAEESQWAEFLDAGAFPPRPLVPRNLTQGVYRGGDRPGDIYLRLVQGIAGTPMPAVNLVDEPSGAGLTVDQVWDLVAYVRSLAPPGRWDSQPAASSVAAGEAEGARGQRRADGGAAEGGSA